MSSKSNDHFSLIMDSTLQFLFLFSNADAFYISARRALLYGWIGVGISNAHQAIELYIKAIITLEGKDPSHSHQLIELLQEGTEPIFRTLQGNSRTVEFMEEISKAYLTFRYGEAGSQSNTHKILTLLDEIAFGLRNAYLAKIKSPSKKIYIPPSVKVEFLKDNLQFTENDISDDQLNQLLPVS